MVRPLRFALFAVGIVVAWWSGHSPAWSQLPTHRLQSVFPTGGQAGETVEIQLNGSDLEFINTLWFDHPGLKGFHLEGTKFKVAIAPDVPVGHYDLRVVGPLGVSNPRVFVVGNRPETVEAEVNNTPEQSNSITINSVVNGQINGQTDVDWFAFEGHAGQRVFVDVSAARIDSRLDGKVRIFASDGREIAQSDEGFGLDPFIDLELPRTGRYLIQVFDVVYNGSPDHVYRLTLHDGPHLDAIVPAAMEPGQTGTFTLIGRNLGGEPWAESPDTVGATIERKEVTITAPDCFLPDPERPHRDFVPSVAARRRGFEYRFEGPSGGSNPLFIGEAKGPVLIEEVSSSETPRHLELPCDLTGSFAAPGDVDVYRFEAKAGQVWWIEVLSQRIGSPADPMFVVQQVLEDGSVKDHATADDLPDPGMADRFPTATVDAAVRWEAPADGLYQIIISDLYNAQEFDPRLFYRLIFRPEQPDFQLFVAPSNAAQPDGVTVRAGGRASATVLAYRIDGFNNPILVEAEALPPGISCEAVVIGPGQAQAPIVFEAEEGTVPDVGTARFVGRSLSGDRKEVLAATAGTPRLDNETTQTALAGAMTWPPAGGNIPPLARVTRGFALAVREGAPFRLKTKPENLVIQVGQEVELNVEVERLNGFEEAVQVATSDLPPNMPEANATIDKENTSTTLKLNVPENVAPGVYTIRLNGTGAFPFNKDPNAEEKENVNAVEPSKPIRLTVRQ